MNDNLQAEEVLQRIEREVRMREGAGKLLAACSQRAQALEAAKSLLTCDARILALLGQLQRLRRAQVLQRAAHRPSDDPAPCGGTVAISDLRIPLMWKDSEYFKNKGELHRCAVFCLLHCGTEIQDSGLVLVDRTLTDICFEDTIVFDNVGPDFQLRVELYSSRAAEDFPPEALAPRRGPRSLGSSSGRKIRAAFESATLCGYISTGGDARPGHLAPPLFPYLSAQGPKYNMLAQTTLSIKHVQGGFKTHDLQMAATEDSPSWLPLYGSVCCRLVAQPACLVQPAMSGDLQVKDDSGRWQSVFAVLSRKSLACYRSRDAAAAAECEDEPLLVIPVRKDTVVHASEEDAARRLCVIGTPGEAAPCAVAAASPEETRRWSEAVQQHVFNLGQWRQCCDQLLHIEAQSRRKSLMERQGSLYHELEPPLLRETREVGIPALRPQMKETPLRAGTIQVSPLGAQAEPLPSASLKSCSASRAEGLSGCEVAERGEKTSSGRPTSDSLDYGVGRDGLWILLPGRKQQLHDSTKKLLRVPG